MINEIDSRRIHLLNNKAIKTGDYVLYWMQQSQRAVHNHALNHAVKLADSIEIPVLVFFGITENYPDANLRHFIFMLEGLRETEEELRKLGIKLITWIIDPVDGVVNLSKNAAAVITDFGYLRHQRLWREKAAAAIECSCSAVESDIIIPVETASKKEEYSASTLRPKILSLLKFNLQLPGRVKPGNSSLHLKMSGVDLNYPNHILKDIITDRTVQPVPGITGGTSKGKQLLNYFIKNRLNEYHIKRSDPSLDFGSGLSPYLHFGHVSPVYIALKIMDTGSQGRDAFLEELIIRRELGINFVYYNKNYDSINSLPLWSKTTLKKHENDRREYVYSLIEFEQSLTHDPYWNSAQNELVLTGKIHNYMRMYWGKKIIEWSETPDAAYDAMVYLNNKYALDGRDPNSYAGIAWCFGRHDRPWRERPVFGTVRYMNENGLKRKFEMDEYIKKYKSRQIK